MESTPSTITMGVQAGGPCPPAIRESLMTLRGLLASCCPGPYSADVKEFAYLVRLDGEFQQFNFEGVERARHNRKEQFVQIDLGIPVRRWKGVTNAEFRTYVMDCVLAGAQVWIDKLAKEKIPMDADAFRRDLEIVKEKYLQSNDGGVGQ